MVHLSNLTQSVHTCRGIYGNYRQRKQQILYIEFLAIRGYVTSQLDLLKSVNAHLRQNGSALL